MKTISKIYYFGAYHILNIKGLRTEMNWIARDKSLNNWESLGLLYRSIQIGSIFIYCHDSEL